MLLARRADETELGRHVPDIEVESIGTLLDVMSASMLVIATFAAGSMVSAYASASSTATPRAFPLVVADDVSQNALSTFVGAFIFSIVGLIAVTNGYYDRAGRFTLFVLILAVLAAVTATFVRWVDRIARLGRQGPIIDKVEWAATEAIRKRRRAPTLRAAPAPKRAPGGVAVHSDSVGYVRRIDVSELQSCAEKADAVISVLALPGTFSAPGVALAAVHGQGHGEKPDLRKIAAAFEIGDSRRFDEDPRFGLVVLAEIAGRALSPAVNDPGTAIDVIGTMVRLFALWAEPVEPDQRAKIVFDRVEMPEVALGDLFDDAFISIARDGAQSFEVTMRLQKALLSLAGTGDEEMREAALRHVRQSLARTEDKLFLPAHLEAIRAVAARALAVPPRTAGGDSAAV